MASPGEIVKEGKYRIRVDMKDGSDPSFEYVRAAVDFALNKQVTSIVTGPISKERWQKAGLKYKGHTEYLAERAGVKDHSMFFWSENLKVSLFTIHVPLKEIFMTITRRNVENFLKNLDHNLKYLFKKKFTFLISGLNPHAGELGLMGNEEEEIIKPALKTLQTNNDLSLAGPFPPDTIFLKALQTPDCVVVCWYHDQGLIPFKLLNLHRGVNITLGLPFIRTSPDHGTAFDIAGKNQADPSSMRLAIQLAQELAMLKEKRTTNNEQP